MRWLFVSNQHHPEHGGIGASLHSIASAAGRADWDVHVLTIPGTQAIPGATMHRIASPDMDPAFEPWIEPLRRAHRIRPYRYGLWALEVAHWLERTALQPDAIEFMDCQAQAAGAIDHEALSVSCAEAPRLIHALTPMFVGERIDQVDMTRFGRTIYHQWERRCIETADGLGTAGAPLDQHIGRERDVTIPTYICDNAAVQSPSSRTHANTIVYVGTIEHRKGVDIGVSAVGDVLAEHPHFNAIFIGNDTYTGPGEMSMIAHLQQHIAPAFRDRIVFTGAQAHDEVLDHVSRAAVVIVPSRFDSYNIVAAEAVMRGVPVVISHEVGIGRFAPSMFRYENHASEELAGAIDQVLAHPVQAAERVRAAQEELCRSCGWAVQERARQRWLEIVASSNQTPKRDGRLRRQVIQQLREIEAMVSTANHQLNLSEKYVADSALSKS